MSSLSKTFPIRMVRTRRHIYSPREVDKNVERKLKRNSLLDQSRSLPNVQLNADIKANTSTAAQDKKLEIKKKPGRKRKVNTSKKMKKNQNSSLKINVTKRKRNLSLSNEQQIKKRKKNSQKNLLNFCTSTPKTGTKRRIKTRRRGKTRYSASFLKTPIYKHSSPRNSFYHLNSTIKLKKNVSKTKPAKPSSTSIVEICDNDVSESIQIKPYKNTDLVIDLVSPAASDNESDRDYSIIIQDQTGSASFKTQPFKLSASIAKKFDDDDSVIILDDTESATIKCADNLKESIGIQMTPKLIHKNDAATNTSKQNSTRTSKINIATNTTVVDLTTCNVNNNNSKTKQKSANSSKMAVNMPLQQMNLNFSSRTTEQMTEFIKRITYLEEQFLKHSVEAQPSTVINQEKSTNPSTFGSNIYNPFVPLKKGLRLVVIDGSNVAMGHSNGKYFSCEGLKICIDYFIQRGHEVKAFVPQYRRQINRSSNPTLLENLAKVGLVIFTPSRRVHGRMIVPYDDRYIVQCAAERGGVIVSNDNYRDLLQENPCWRETIEKRLLMWTWCGNMIMFPIDPCGRGGPSLDQFLRF